VRKEYGPASVGWQARKKGSELSHADPFSLEQIRRGGQRHWPEKEKDLMFSYHLKDADGRVVGCIQPRIPLHDDIARRLLSVGLTICDLTLEESCDYEAEYELEMPETEREPLTDEERIERMEAEAAEWKRLEAAARIKARLKKEAAERDEGDAQAPA